LTPEGALMELARIRASVVSLEVFFQEPPAAPAPTPPAPPAAPTPATAAPLADPAKFFNAVRGTLWPKLTANQVSGCNAILLASAGVLPLAWAAYGLATAYHETAYTMQPIHERGSGDGSDPDAWDDYLERYDTGEMAKRLGNTPAADGDGVRYAGAGLVQLTGAANYKRATTELRAMAIITASEDLFAEPALALRPDIASAVLVYGMKGGWFSGKGFNDYLPATASRSQFGNARRIINGTDKADQIAGYALSFQAALQAGGWA
jgi:putative chitinase